MKVNLNGFPEKDRLDSTPDIHTFVWPDLSPDLFEKRVTKIVWRRIDPETGEEVEVEEITNFKLANIVRKKSEQ